MVNQFFRFTSRGPGFLLAAMVVAALPICHSNLDASAQSDLSRNPAAMHVIGRAVLAEASATLSRTDSGFIPSGYHHWPF